MIDRCRTLLIQILVSRAGSILSTIIAAVVATALARLADLSPDIAAQIPPEQLAAILWALAMSAINYATTRWLTRDAAAIQSALVRTGSRIAIDGWIGDQTVHELQERTGLPVRRAYPVRKKSL